MSDAFTIETLRAILDEHVGVDISPHELQKAETLTMEELGVDSLAVFEIQGVVERDFDVRLPAELLEMTGGEVVRYVELAIVEEVA
ncbi:acyl carrier protein [Nocardia sp. NPDC101769]|uniref:acyl carrier protein n=1 Tax=Nocardia sp. NPDC101769 TaxID=3364333 RepID=UPI003822A0D7